MRAGWGYIAALMQALAWCVILTYLFTYDDVAVLVVPAGLVAVDLLRRLGPVLGQSPAARQLVDLAMVATGGVVVSGGMLLPASSRDAARLALLVTMSLAFSLYALGLAAWTQTVMGGGRVTRDLRASVVAWWTTLAIVAAGDWLSADAGSSLVTRGVWVFRFGDDRGVHGGWASAAIVTSVVAFGLLARAHHVLRTSLQQLAEEHRRKDEPSRAG